jgi:protein-disulfide isomerase
VEFADFECPYCRKLHPILKQLEERNGSAVRLVRLHMPLLSHPHSMPAAQAAVCAELEGKGAEMADALFSGALDENRLLAYATRLGLEPQRFQACRAAASTEARINADRELLESADFRGLPTTYVGRQRVIGLADAALYQDLVDRERAGREPVTLSGWLFLGLTACLVLFVTRLSLARNPLQ